MTKLEAIPVERIVRDRDRYIMAVVDFDYYVNGVGPLDLEGKPKKPVPEDPQWKVTAWRKGGSLRSSR